MRVESWAASPYLADGGFYIARRGYVHSATAAAAPASTAAAAAASTAAAEGGREENTCGCNRRGGKHVLTFRGKPNGRQPCAPYQEGCLVGHSHVA